MMVFAINHPGILVRAVTEPASPVSSSSKNQICLQTPLTFSDTLIVVLKSQKIRIWNMQKVKISVFHIFNHKLSTVTI